MKGEIPVVLVSSGSTDGNLQLHDGDVVPVGSERWFEWLRHSSSFRFVSGFAGEDSFTARKHERDSGDFWYAYRKINGKVRNSYLGKAESLDTGKLLTTALKLSQTPKRGANEMQLENAAVDSFSGEQTENKSLAECITSEVMQEIEAKFELLKAENEQLRLQVDELTNFRESVAASQENLAQVIAAIQEVNKTPHTSKFTKALKVKLQNEAIMPLKALLEGNQEQYAASTLASGVNL